MSQDETSPPTPPRLTVTARDALDGAPFDRDVYAAALAVQADPEHALEGDRVRITGRDGTVVQGRWVYEDTSGQWVVEPDEGPPYPTHGANADVQILARAERRLLPLLTAGEAMSTAQLLDELAGVYAEEPLGRLARDLAARLYERLGI